MSDPATWHDLAAAADLRPDEPVAATLADGHELVLLRVGNAVHAADNLCTHGYARLCDGFVVDAELECPLHQARFDAATGAVTCGPATEPIRVYPVRIDGGRVWVQR